MPALSPLPSLASPQVPPYKAFDPATVQIDPGSQWRLSQGLKGIERGAAARGTLLTGGTQKAIVDYNQGAASQEYGNAYQRALQTYVTNRDTDRLNASRLPPDAGVGTVGAPASLGSLSSPSLGGPLRPPPPPPDYQDQIGRYRQQQEADHRLLEERLAAERTRQDGLRVTGLQQQDADRRMAEERLTAERDRLEGQRVTGLQLQSQAAQRAEDARRQDELDQQNRELAQRQLAGNAAAFAPRVPQAPPVLSSPGTEIAAWLEQQRLEKERREAERVARENAAMPPQPKPVPYLTYPMPGRAVGAY